MCHNLRKQGTGAKNDPMVDQTIGNHPVHLSSTHRRTTTKLNDVHLSTKELQLLIAVDPDVLLYTALRRRGRISFYAATPE